jgi:hypothetical protein
VALGFLACGRNQMTDHDRLSGDSEIDTPAGKAGAYDELPPIAASRRFGAFKGCR